MEKLQLNIEHLNQILRVVQTRVNALDRDLPDATRRRRVREIWKADFYNNIPDNEKTESNEKITEQLMHNIRMLKSEFTEQRQLASDAKSQVLIKAIRTADKVSMGDLVLANSLGGLSPDELSMVATYADKPALLVALRGELSKRDLEPAERSMVHDSINKRSESFVDKRAVGAIAKAELEALRAELAYQEARGELKNPSDRLTLGREMKSLEEILGVTDEK